ncbi:MFS transporter [Sphingosinicella xenopeptidilytica]|uniref:MFS transporter n=1 Tax=Sphingosinicella xenopeptidilytica TaxID=364098 RepID=A0ABW3C3L0_SPHXN
MAGKSVHTLQFVGRATFQTYQSIGSIKMTQRKLTFGRWGVTATLSICFFMSYVDRLILGLLVEPVKATFQASDIQIGLLFGATFGVVYALAGIPIGFVVDRGNRKWLVVCGLTVWSLLTVLAGFATALQWLFICRIGVAIGEATLSPAATSIISDLFSPKTRALPISVFFASGMIGAGGSFIVGGAVVAAMTALIASGMMPSWAEPWRLTFIAVGVPGLLLAMLMIFVIREPKRTGVDANDKASGVRELLSLVTGRWWGMGAFFLAMAFSQLAPASIAAWVPTILQRDYGYSIAEAGLTLGLTQLVTAPTGQIILGALAGALFRRLQRGVAFVLVCAIAITAATLVYAMLPLAANSAQLLVFLGVAIFSSIGITSIPPIAVGLLLPNRMRGSSIAAYYLVIALLGVGVGPVLLPWIASFMPEGPGTYARAMALMGGFSGVASLVLCIVAMVGLRRRVETQVSGEDYGDQAEVRPANA